MFYKIRMARIVSVLFLCLALIANLLFMSGVGLGKSATPGLRVQESPTDIFPITESFKNSTAPNWLFFDDAHLTGNGTIDPVGDGWLRLTTTDAYQRGSAVYNLPFSSTEGIAANFQYADYGGTGADGFTFYLIDGATASPTTGAYGGSLGYSPQVPDSLPGVTNGYVGIALDEFGNFSNTGYGGCPAGCPGFKPESVVLRGSGNGLVGYNYLDMSQLTSLTPPHTIDQVTRSGARWVRILIINEQITVQIDFGSGYQTIIDKYDLSTAVGQATLPATFKLGFSGSTGDSTNYHEIRNLTIAKPAQVNIADVASSPTVLSGQPVSFTVTVTNDNTNAVDTASISVPVPANLSNVTWTCTGSPGSSCGSASGSGAINQTGSLAKNGTLTYQITGTAGTPGSTINHSAALSLGPAYVNLGNSQASATVTIGAGVSADLAIRKTYQLAYIADITYTIVARNLGPGSAAGAVISDTLWANIVNATWTCVGANGAVCTANGSGSIMDTLTAFPSGGVVTYTLSAQISDWTHIENRADIIPPAGVTDPDMSNNSDHVHTHLYYFPLIYRKAGG